MLWNLCKTDIKQILTVGDSCEGYLLGENELPISLTNRLVKWNNLIFHLIFNLHTHTQLISVYERNMPE